MDLTRMQEEFINFASAQKTATIAVERWVIAYRAARRRRILDRIS